MFYRISKKKKKKNKKKILRLISKLSKFTILVIKVPKNGSKKDKENDLKYLTMSAPCKYCAKILNYLKINVIYSTGKIDKPFQLIKGGLHPEIHVPSFFRFDLEINFGEKYTRKKNVSRAVWLLIL
jgi:hypothetical protein